MLRQINRLTIAFIVSITKCPQLHHIYNSAKVSPFSTPSDLRTTGSLHHAVAALVLIIRSSQSIPDWYSVPARQKAKKLVLARPSRLAGPGPGEKILYRQVSRAGPGLDDSARQILRTTFNGCSRDKRGDNNIVWVLGFNGVANFIEKGRRSWILFQKNLISFCLYSSERLMASPLFRIHDSNLAVWRTGFK
jgi:hypothetical protein